MTDRRGTKRFGVRECGNVLLTLGAIAGVVCILATVAFALLDVRPLVFRSGSMSPAIETGALGLARQADAVDLKKGDVVSVTTGAGDRITHRIQSVTVSGGQATLLLKGDANSTPDAETYVVSSADRVFLDVPRLGYVVAWVSGPVGIFVGGLVAGGVLITTAGALMRRDAGGRRRAVAVVLVIGLGAGSATVASPWQTLAAFTDTATMTGSTKTFAVPAPAIPPKPTGCTVTGNAVTGFTATIIFPAVTTPFALNYSATLVNTNTTLPVTVSGSNRQVQVTSGLLGSLLGQRVTVRVVASLPSAPTWQSVTDRQLDVALAGLGLTCVT